MALWVSYADAMASQIRILRRIFSCPLGNFQEIHYFREVLGLGFFISQLRAQLPISDTVLFLTKKDRCLQKRGQFNSPVRVYRE